MIQSITIDGFKSILSMKLDLGRVNCFIGANGAGKSNILEAIGVLGAAANGKVDDEALLRRGVRPGVPPAVDSVNGLKAAITSWTGLGILGDIKLCIPSKSIDAWLAAAVFYGDSKLMNNIECENMASKLEQLPKNLRIKKSQRVYQNYAEKIAENWDQVRQLCTQADAFQQEMQ
jgi:ABC-type branched-subunit amino acid transport system ATPase component